MKKPERVKKVFKWGVISGIFLLGVVAPFVLATVALQLASEHLAFAQSLAKYPVVPFWVPFVPQGKLGDFPESYVVSAGLVVVLCITISRFHHHWNRLGQENLKRDLDNV